MRKFYHKKLPREISISDLPTQISGWSSREVAYDKSIIDVLEPDATIYRQYEENGQIPITLFMACYNTAEKSDRSHSPIVCFTGQGWKILSSSHKNIPIDTSYGASIRVNRLEQQNFNSRMVTYYWYQSSNKSYSNRGMQKISLLINKLVGENEKNAFVRLTVQEPAEMQLRNAEEDMERFVRVIYPKLKKLLS